MRKANKVIFHIFLLMFIPFFILPARSVFSAEFTIHENLTDYQIRQITSKLEFELMPNERLYVEFFHGFMQATRVLKVHIENVESEMRFRSRFQDHSLDGINISDLEIFQFEGRRPRDFSAVLLFSDESESLKATFSIVGHIPKLQEVYDFLVEPYELLNDPAIRIVLIIQFTLITFLVGQVPIWMIRRLSSKAKN